MAFDPYAAWLGLPPGRRPPDPYTLLGVRRFERDPKRIAAAVADRARAVRNNGATGRPAEVQSLLDELEAAGHLLSDPSRRRRLEVDLRAAEKRARQPEPVSPPHTGLAGAAVMAKRGRQVRPRSKRLGIWLGGATFSAAALGAAWLLWPNQERVESTHVAAKPAGRPVNPGPAAAAGGPAAPRQAAAAVYPPPVEAVRPITPSSATGEPPAPSPVEFAAVPVPAVEADRPYVPSIAEYRVPEFASEADRERYAGHVRELLDEAFSRKGDAASLAKHVRSASESAPGHPFTEYVAALAYWKRLRFADAEAHLWAASGTDASPFLPGRRASIRLSMNRDRQAAALDEAVRLAGAASARDDAARDAGERSLRWLGRLIAGMEAPWLPGGTKSEDVSAADAAIRRSLGNEAVRTYEAGRRSLRDDFAARAAAVEARIASITSDHEVRKAESLEKIAEDRDAAGDAKAEVDRSAAEWKTWLDDGTKGLDADLKALEAAHQQLSVQAEAAAATYFAVSQEITRLQALEEADGPPSIVGAASAGQLMATVNQSVAQLKLLNGRIAEVRRQAQTLLTKRQALVARYEAATKTLVAKGDSLRKWEGILKRKADDAVSEEADDSPAAKTLRRELRDLNTYLPFDLEAERDAVLRALNEGRSDRRSSNE